MSNIKTLTKAQTERIALLVEECAEVQQIAMKILRHGYESFNPFDEHQRINRILLENEIGDLLFSLDLMFKKKDIDTGQIESFKRKKESKVRNYLHFNKV